MYQILCTADELGGTYESAPVVSEHATIDEAANALGPLLDRWAEYHDASPAEAPYIVTDAEGHIYDWDDRGCEWPSVRLVHRTE